MDGRGQQRVGSTAPSRDVGMPSPWRRSRPEGAPRGVRGGRQLTGHRRPRLLPCVTLDDRPASAAGRGWEKYHCPWAPSSPASRAAEMAATLRLTYTHPCLWDPLLSKWWGSVPSPRSPAPAPSSLYFSFLPSPICPERTGLFPNYGTEQKHLTTKLLSTSVPISPCSSTDFLPETSSSSPAMPSLGGRTQGYVAISTDSSVTEAGQLFPTKLGQSQGAPCTGTPSLTRVFHPRALRCSQPLLPGGHPLSLTPS